MKECNTEVFQDVVQAGSVCSEPGDVLVYECASHEAMRVCLWLESIFQRIQANVNGGEKQHARVCLSLLVDLLEIVSRPDLKSKLIQLLKQASLSLRKSGPAFKWVEDDIALVLARIDEDVAALHSCPGRISDVFRDNQFLQMIRLQKHNPAGLCETVLPPYKLWLSQSNEKQWQDLQIWLTEFRLVDDIVRLLLMICRSMADTCSFKASNGFYQEALNTSTIYQLIRIEVPAALRVYPEISLGKHRLVVRFVSMDLRLGSRPVQLADDLPVTLAKCF